MTITEYTNKGSRNQNQDYVTHELLENNHAIFVVADGMGGYSHGDVASRLVADAIIDCVSSHYLQEADVVHLMAEAYDYANDTLAIKRIAMGGCEMGTVVVSLYYDGHAAHITWLGDSRCYLFRNGKQLFCTPTPKTCRINGNGKSIEYLSLNFEAITWSSTTLICSSTSIFATKEKYVSRILSPR